LHSSPSYPAATTQSLLRRRSRSTLFPYTTLFRSYNIETKSWPAGDLILHPEPQIFIDRLLRVVEEAGVIERTTIQSFDPRTLRVDRKSTRLNSSHVKISYAVFCLK